jgi:hypothetical protein
LFLLLDNRLDGFASDHAAALARTIAIAIVSPANTDPDAPDQGIFFSRRIHLHRAAILLDD